MTRVRAALTVNGRPRELELPPGKPLAAALREDCGTTSVHLGCADGTCGACTVLVDGEALRSCLMLAVQCDGTGVRTAEGLAPGDPLRAAVNGCCGGGMAMLVAGSVAGDPGLATDGNRLDRLLASHACRSAGHEDARRAVVRAARAAVGAPARPAAAGHGLAGKPSPSLP